MAYFSALYQLFAEDVSSLGPRKYLTSAQFQSATWERMLAEGVLSEKPRARDEFESVSLLFQEGYNRALAPVSVGESIAVLVSLEERGPSALRLFFRAVRLDGDPIACGFQTVISAAQSSGLSVPFPRALAEFLHEHADLHERAPGAFLERLVSGEEMNVLFGEETRAAARAVNRPAAPPLGPRTSRASVGMRVGAGAGQGGGRSGARATGGIRASSTARPSSALRAIGGDPAAPSGAPLRASVALRPTGAVHASAAFPAAELARRSGVIAGPLPESQEVVMRPHGVAFVFPDTGSYDGRLLRELYDYMPYLDDYFNQADGVARRHFRHAFLPLVHTTSIADHDEALSKCPDLASLGILLTGVLLAEALQEKSVKPDVLLGEGLGEVAALATAGAFDVRTGLEIVAARVLAQRASGASRDAATRFSEALAKQTFGAARLQVYSPADGQLYEPRADFGSALGAHLLNRGDVAAALNTLRGKGCDFFVPCGGSAEWIEAMSTALPQEGQVQAVVRSGRSLPAGLAAVASAVTAGAARPAPAPAIAAAAPPQAQPAADDGSAGFPVAIVGLGCVLPGARNVDALWRAVCTGTSSIAEPAADDPGYRDFVVPGDVLPDKTYTLLAATAGTLEHDSRLPYSREEFFSLARSQQLLALALAQCLDRPRAAWAPKPKRMSCLLGSSADASREYDEALVVEGFRRVVGGLDDQPEQLRERLVAAASQMPDLGVRDPEAAAPFPALNSVVQRLLGSEVEAVLIDAESASSLLAIDLAVQRLRYRGDDFIVAGGVWSPGPAHNSLRAQFRGLATQDSYPFDERGDGVVEGEGAAVIALKRLSDALAAGDRIYAVIRGTGVSSDGRSPGVTVPRAAGEALAIRRAYASSGIDAGTIQLVEANATAAAQADAVEFEALRSELSVSARTADQCPVYLRSITALIGHTGAAAGAASIVTVCRALEEHTVAPQFNCAVLNPAIDLADTPFEIPAAMTPWPANIGGLPRRAAVNSFGLGGVNAHVIIEEFDRGYHQRLASRVSVARARAPLAVVAIGGRFPVEDRGLADLPVASDGGPFRPEALDPDEHRLIADALSQMDVAQLASLSAGARALKSLPGWAAHRERVGVCLGLTGKTARSVTATHRVYLDRLARVFQAEAPAHGITSEAAAGVVRRHAEAVRAASGASNPYTLSGAMAGAVAARLANLHDLHGPAAVIDAGGASAYEALRQAELWLAGGEADLVLAGGLDVVLQQHVSLGAPQPGVPAQPEGASLLALTTPEFGEARGWSPLALLDLADDGTVRLRPAGSQGDAATELEAVLGRPRARVTGIADLALAVDAARRGKATTLRWQTERPGPTAPRTTTSLPRRAVLGQRADELSPDSRATP